MIEVLKTEKEESKAEIGHDRGSQDQKKKKY
jgi:hypothetical protein